VPNSLTTTVQDIAKKLSDSLSERQALKQQLQQLDERIHKLRQAVFGLSTLIESEAEFEKIKKEYPRAFEDYSDSRLGLTDAVRAVLRNAATFMSPVEVKDEVITISSALQGHKSAISSVHTVLRRLVEADEVSSAISDDGKTLYAWTGDQLAMEKIAQELAAEDRGEFLQRIKPPGAPPARLKRGGRKPSKKAKT
jgi:chromosome segregation ATPase